MPRREQPGDLTNARPRRSPVAAGVALLIVGGVAVWWLASRLPASYSITTMGYADFGGGPGESAGHTGHGDGSGISIETLATDPSLVPDVTVDLVARQGQVRLADGRVVKGFTLNGTSPGPAITAVAGQLVQVRVRNEDVADGLTLHWHGLDVPNSVDGVAGVTQDAIMPGETYGYRFIPRQAGTFWYHSHQMSHPQVLGGLLGPLIILPSDKGSDAVDLTALVHLYGGVRTINGAAGESHVPAAPGTVARVRLINTDGGPMPVWVPGASFRVIAVDGSDVHEPGLVHDQAVLVTAGARVDLAVVVPDTGAVRIAMAGAGLVVGAGSAPSGPAPSVFVDLLQYGTPAPIGFDPSTPDRRFDYTIGRSFGLLDGVPGLWWTINGHQYPDVPMFMVAEGDVVAFRVTNNSGEVHPMHLHGHHALVLARNGRPATGSPWWVDSLNVENGESYDIVLRADNPGIWMDHCHNLPHAREGLMTHLAYIGYTTPYVVGDPHRNHPE